MLDFFKTFFETSKERIKNPLIGTFIISWLAINWRPIFILLFSNESIENRIDHVVVCYSSLNTYFIAPFIIALIYVIILPYFMWGLDWLVIKSTIGRKENVLHQVLLDYRGKQKIAVEESKLEDSKANFREKADLNSQIETLRTQLDEREESIKNLSAEMEMQNVDNDSLRKVLNDRNQESFNVKKITIDEQYSEFMKSDMYDFFKDIGISIRGKRDFPTTIHNMLREKYIFQGIIEEVIQDENMYYQFTEKGRSFWKIYVTNA